MLIWGTRSRILNTDTSLSKVNCAVCSQESHMRYHIVQDYFTIFGISFFPIRKRFSKVCESCKRISKIKNRNIQEDVIDSGVVDKLLRQDYGTARYYLGLYILIGLIILGYIALN